MHFICLVGKMMCTIAVGLSFDPAAGLGSCYWDHWLANQTSTLEKSTVLVSFNSVQQSVYALQQRSAWNLLAGSFFPLRVMNSTTQQQLSRFQLSSGPPFHFLGFPFYNPLLFTPPALSPGSHWCDAGNPAMPALHLNRTLVHTGII